MPEEKFDFPLSPSGHIRIRGKIDNRFIPKGEKATMAMQETKMRKSIDFKPFDISAQIDTYIWAMRQIAKRDKLAIKRFKAYPTIARRQMPGPRVKAPLFGREMIERTDEQIMQWQTDTLNACHDMLDAAIYPNKMDDCFYMCDFKEPCDLRGDPADMKAVLRSEYHVKVWEDRK